MMNNTTIRGTRLNINNTTIRYAIIAGASQPCGSWAKSIRCPQNLEAAKKAFATAPMLRPDFGIIYSHSLRLYAINDSIGHREVIAERIA